jgi:hypothetical protein
MRPENDIRWRLRKHAGASSRRPTYPALWAALPPTFCSHIRGTVARAGLGLDRELSVVRGFAAGSLRSSAPISECSGALAPSSFRGWPGVRRGWC